MTNTVNGVRPSGFHLGLKQSSIRLQSELVIPKAADFSTIGNELLERFGVAQKPINSHIARPLNDDEQAALEFAWHAMALATGLLQAIKIPCFDRGTALDIQCTNRPERRYRFSCLFPAVEYHPSAWITQSFDWSYRLLSRLVQPNTAESEVEELLNELHEKFITEAKKRIPGGDSTVPVLKTAFELDIPFTHLGRGIYQLGWGKRRRLSDRSSSELDSAVGSKISHDKAATAQMLRQAGLPAPVHIIVRTREAAAEAAQRLRFPVVVKPADKDRGEGVTVNIYDAEGAAKAFDIASKLSNTILVERQVPGICHRILVSGNASPYTVARLPLAVEGDGIHSVRDLIAMANRSEARKAKHRRQKLFPADELTEKTLQDAGLNFDSIPDKGKYAPLRPIETTEWGGLPKVFSDEIHPDNLRAAIQAARLMNLNVAGVDLITEDISKPWYENGAVINEVNFVPFLGLRYEYQRAGNEMLVRALFPQGARIPVEIFIGDEHAWAAAQARQEQLVSFGTRAFVSSHVKTAEADGEITFAFLPDRLNARCRALLMNQDVEALLLVAQTDELLAHGLPVDSVNTINLVNHTLVSMKDPSLAATEDAANKLVRMLRPYYRPDAP